MPAKKYKTCEVCGKPIINRQKHAKYCKECAFDRKEYTRKKCMQNYKKRNGIMTQKEKVKLYHECVEYLKDKGLYDDFLRMIE